MPVWRSCLRWREPFFLTWTALDVLLVALVVAADGGDESPLRASSSR